jgi:hypothetical protein
MKITTLSLLSLFWLCVVSAQASLGTSDVSPEAEDASPFHNPLAARDDRNTNDEDEEISSLLPAPIGARDPLEVSAVAGGRSGAVNKCLATCNISKQPVREFNQCRESCLFKYTDHHKAFNAPVANSVDGKISKRKNKEMKQAVTDCASHCKTTKTGDEEVKQCLKGCITSRIKPSIVKTGRAPQKRDFDDTVIVEKRDNSIDVKYIDNCYVQCRHPDRSPRGCVLTERLQVTTTERTSSICTSVGLHA